MSRRTCMDRPLPSVSGHDGRSMRIPGESTRPLGTRLPRSCRAGAGLERRDQRVGYDLERAARDLARLAEARERLLLGEPLTLHEDPLRTLDRLPRRERLGERLGLLA